MTTRMIKILVRLADSSLAACSRISAVILVVLSLAGPKFAMASDWVSVGGNVHFGEIPVCALVLINGQTQFSCDGTGRYDMDVPIDDNGMITVMAFADGFAPFTQIVTPEQAVEYPVGIILNQLSPSLPIQANYQPSATVGQFYVSAPIYFGTVPVCALALANGQTMFSCGESLGQFSLDVPIDQHGNITLMIFATGFRPYKLTTNVVLDSDSDGIMNYLDYDDDNDGAFDTDDSCPLNPMLGCKQITDTIIVNGKEWAQVYLFNNLTWNQINSVCPAGIFTGVLKNYDVTGWTWANIEDVNALFNTYIGSDVLGQGSGEYRDTTSWALEYFAAGWWPTEIDLGYGIYGLTSGSIEASGLVPWAFLRSGIPNSSPNLSWVFTGTSKTVQADDPCGYSCGGWFFRSPIH